MSAPTLPRDPMELPPIPAEQKRHVIKISVHDLATLVCSAEAKRMKVAPELLDQFINERAVQYYAACRAIIQMFQVFQTPAKVLEIDEAARTTTTGEEDEPEKS